MTARCQWTTSPIRVSSAAAPAAGRFDGTPAVPAFFLNRGVYQGRAAEVGRGIERDQARSCPKVNGFRAEALSQNPPDPHRSAAENRSNRLTTRPDREPGLTGHSFRGVSPTHYRMATVPGTHEYRDRPGH